MHYNVNMAFAGRDVQNNKVLCGIIWCKNITAHQMTNTADNMMVDRDSVLNTTDPVLEMPL